MHILFAIIHVCMHATCIPGALGGKKRFIRSLETGLTGSHDSLMG